MVQLAPKDNLNELPVPLNNPEDSKSTSTEEGFQTVEDPEELKKEKVQREISELRKDPRYKFELCDYYMNDKECKKGKTYTELCSYAHGHEDMKGYLPPESRPLNWKTQLCNTKYKHDEINCGYAHSHEEATKNWDKLMAENYKNKNVIGYNHLAPLKYKY